MNKWFKTATMLAVLTVSAFSTSAAVAAACAADARCFFQATSSKTVQLIALQNGFTLHKYEDGKMALEDPFGRPVFAQEGQLVTTTDGATIRMVGNEVARLTAELGAVNHR